MSSSNVVMAQVEVYTADGGATGILNAAGDSAIALACLVIGGALFFVVRRQPQIVFPSAFLVLGIAMSALGVAHAIAAAGVGGGFGGFVAIMKCLAGGAALLAILFVVRAAAGVVRLPSRAELQRQQVSLEERVAARTAELTAANEQLRHEIVQREQAEAEIRRLNVEMQTRLAELQSLFQVLPVGVAIATDASCREIRTNQAFADILGLPADRNASLSAAAGEAPTNFRVLHDGRELRPHELPLQRAARCNEPVRGFEETIVRSDGVSLDVIANAVPIRDAQGRVRGCVGTFQDITAQKQGERQRLEFERKMLQSQKLESIGVLAGGIAHDFNNLLTGILGHANFARSELARGMFQVDHLLAQVEVSAQRAAELCRQLLAYAGKGKFVVRLIDLNAAVEQLVPLLRLSTAKKVDLQLQLGAGLPPFRGDPTQLNQVLVNLVANASEAIGAEVGTVTIRTERVTLSPMEMLTINGAGDIEPGAFLRLEISDTGCGIPPEAVPHIFEPFFTTKALGRGLGLAAVIGIVHGHRGGIRVSSQVGAGTTFELFLPVATAPARIENGSRPPIGTRRGSVLVVDDDETVRSFAATALRAAGCTVQTAVDGEDALAQLRRDPTSCDVVVLDLTMPKLDGEDTLMALRMLAPNLPVILASGHSEQSVVQRFVGRGVAQFLPKPYVAEALIAAVSAAMTPPSAARP